MAETEKAQVPMMGADAPPEKVEEHSASDDGSDHKHNHEVLEGGETVPGCSGCGVNTNRQKVQGHTLPDGRMVIDEEEHYEATGFAFSTTKKWLILSVIFLVQSTMNFNASVYGNVAQPLQDKFGISVEYARAGQASFLIAYGFGCELWAAPSEEFGRRNVLQLSLLLVNIWQIPCALAPNMPTIVICRMLGGLSSAGGSVTLGMIADLYTAEFQQWAVLFVVLSSVGGSVFGPIFGGLIEFYLPNQPNWNFWVQLIFGAVVQIIHFFVVPETRTTVMLDKHAKKLRKQNPEKYGNLYGPNEVKEKRISGSELLKVWIRPYQFLFTEPIVLCLSLLSGFSDALIFTFLEAFGPVFEQWGFSPKGIGLAFVAILIGYFPLGYFSFVPDIISMKRLFIKKGYENVEPERRLLFLLFLAPLETIGLFGFAFTSYGPAVLQGTDTWIAPMIFAALVGWANFAIYYATIDYMIAAYGPYSASATGGNGFARDVLAGIAAFYAGPMYGINLSKGIDPPHNLEFASMVLGFISILVIIPIYIFYWKGAWFRERSKFAGGLTEQRKARANSRVEKK